MTLSSENNTPSPTRRSRTIGCLLGGAVGDALGAPVELSSLDDIYRRFGNTGITRFEPAYGRKGAITDDTQMVLFTAEGLILSTVRSDYAGDDQVITAVYHANLRWLCTQDNLKQRPLIHAHGTCAVIDGVLAGHRELFSQRSPDPACLAALGSGVMGTINQPINRERGCGGLTRSAPIGLAYADSEKSFNLGCAAAALTHGHPDAYLSAGFLAALISRIAGGETLAGAMADAVRILKRHHHHEACLRAIEAAGQLSRSREDLSESIETVAAGRAAHETLAIGLYCALAAGENFQEALMAAVNHSGKSDSTAAVAGSILGAYHGVEVIPAPWLAELELKVVTEEVATDLYDHVYEKSS
jgi:ADP-ribosylglycohydrolase